MAIVITTQPKNIFGQATDGGSSTARQLTFIVYVYDTENATLTYRWQRSTTAVPEWTNTTNTTNKLTSNLTIQSIQNDGYKFRCMISNGTETVYTDVVSAYIYPFISNFVVTLQNNASEKIHVTKELTTILNVQGTLKQETSIIDPVFLIEADLSSLTGLNYVTVPIFGRSYFVNNIRSIRNGLVELSCHVDVISSFADEIKQNYGIVRRQENNDCFNLYLNDGSLVAYQDPYILTEPFPAGFTGNAFILAVAGG